MNRNLRMGFVGGFFAAIGLFGLIVAATLLDGGANAKPDKVEGFNVPSGRIPQEILNARYPRTYFPGTERLGADEMRVTALGTGMPNQSPSNVAASSCLSELCFQRTALTHLVYERLELFVLVGERRGIRV